MERKKVRIRLDLPKQLYHKALATVQCFKAQGNPPLSSLSGLIAHALSQWIDSHMTFNISTQGIEAKEAKRGD